MVTKNVWFIFNLDWRRFKTQPLYSQLYSLLNLYLLTNFIIVTDVQVNLPE